MGRGQTAALILALVLVLGTILGGSAQFYASSEETVRILVKVPSGSTSEQLAEELTGPGSSGGFGILSLGKSSDITVKHTLSAWVALELPADEAARLSKLGYQVEEDKKVYALLETSVPLVNATLVWGLFNNTLGNITGKNVTVAVIDTGIDYTHVDFGSCSTPNHLAGNCRVLPGYDYVNTDADALDDHGHGTHCAGIVGANGTLKGVAPDVTLIAYKTLSNAGTGLSSDTIAALENASAAGYDIISVSLGGLGYANDATSMAVDAAVRNGSIVVVAAGNSGPGGTTACQNGGDRGTISMCSPGTARLALTVGNTNGDTINTGSSRGPGVKSLEIKPEISAPGTGIIAPKLGGDNESRTGTSQAAPHVTGAAALIKQLHPDWSAEHVKAALVGTAWDLGFNVTDQGAGRLDAYAAVNTSFIAPLATLNLRSHFNPLLNASTVFNLTDLSNSSYSVSLSVALRQTGGGSAGVALNASVVTLPALGSTNIEFYFTGLTNATSGIHSGLITANSSDTTINIPFWVEFNGECGAIDRDTTLDRNMNSNGTCMLIVSDDVTLDGDSYILTANGSGLGIDVTGFNNITIRNFGGINNFTDGVYVTGSHNSTIYNNNVTCANTSGSDGIYASTSNQLNITGNTVISPGSAGNGIYLISSSGPYVDSNVVTTSGANNWGVLCQLCSHGMMVSNIVNTTGTGGDAFYLLSQSNITLTSNQVRTVGSSAEGIVFDGGSNNILSSNTFLTEGASSYGVYFSSPASNNTFAQDTINASGAEEIRVDDGCNVNLLTNVFLSNINFTSHSQRAVSVDVNTSPEPDIFGKGNIGYYLTITNLSSDSVSFLDFNITYDESDLNLTSLGTVEEAALLLHEYESAWSQVNTSGVDTDSNTVSSGNLTAFRLMAPIGFYFLECGSVINNDILLWQNLSGADTCFVINSSNVIIDGNGYGISGPNRTGFSGINNTNGTYNVTIRNFAGISNFTAAMIFKGIFNLTIVNNTFDEGMDLQFSHGHNITGNTILLSLSGSVGVGFTSTPDQPNPTSIVNNIISVSGQSWEGMKMDMAEGMYIEGNVITVTSAEGVGIHVSSQEASTHNITSNNITVASTDGLGIVLTDSDNQYITSNLVSVTGTTAKGVFLNNSDQNTFSANQLLTNGTGAYGLYLFNASSNTFSSEIVNVTFNPEVYLGRNSLGNTFDNLLLMGTLNLTSHSLSGVTLDVNSTPPADPDEYQNISHYMSLVNLSSDSYMDFNLTYLDSDLDVVGEASLQLYRYNESSSSWNVLAGSSVDTDRNWLASGNVTLFSLFAPMGTDGTPPSYSEPTNATPDSFSPTTKANFTVNWTDNINVVSAWLELNASGSLTNYSMQNVSATMWNVTVVGVAAGTNAWRFVANDTHTNTNSTPWYGFTIARATSAVVNLTFDGSASNVTFNEYELVWVNGSIVTGDAGTELTVYLDGIVIAAEAPPANLTNFTSQGLYNVTLTYPNTQNYSNTTLTYWVTVNNSHPPFVESYTPNGTMSTGTFTLTVYTNENSSCRYFLSANESYENMTRLMTGNTTTHTKAFSGATAGDYTYYVRCNNTAGIVSQEDYVLTFTVDITVDPGAPSGGGGGGGGIVTGASTGTVESKQIASASVQSGIDMVISSTEIPLRKLAVALLAGVTNVEISVTSSPELPEGVSSGPVHWVGNPREVFSYIEIDHTNLAYNIKSAVIDFRVNRSWIEENGFSRDDILLLRHTGTRWEELPTVEKKLTSNYVYYNATTKKFSVFAISVVAQEAPVEPDPEPEPDEPGITPPTGEVIETPTEPDEPVSASDIPLWMFGVLVLVVGFIAMMGAGFVKHQKQIAAAKEKPEETDRIDPRLRGYISKCRNQGLSEHKIWEMLIQEGWQLELIEKAMKQRRVASTHDMKLRLYIKRARRRGELDMIIRKELIKAGWDKTLVDAELKRGKTKKMPESKPDKETSDE